MAKHPLQQNQEDQSRLKPTEKADYEQQVKLTDTSETTPEFSPVEPRPESKPMDGVRDELRKRNTTEAFINSGGSIAPIDEREKAEAQIAKGEEPDYVTFDQAVVLETADYLQGNELTKPEPIEYLTQRLMDPGDFSRSVHGINDISIREGIQRQNVQDYIDDMPKGNVEDQSFWDVVNPVDAVTRSIGAYYEGSKSFVRNLAAAAWSMNDWLPGDPLGLDETLTENLFRVQREAGEDKYAQIMSEKGFLEAPLIHTFKSFGDFTALMGNQILASHAGRLLLGGAGAAAGFTGGLVATPFIPGDEFGYAPAGAFLGWKFGQAFGSVSGGLGAMTFIEQGNAYMEYSQFFDNDEDAREAARAVGPLLGAVEYGSNLYVMGKIGFNTGFTAKQMRRQYKEHQLKNWLTRGTIRDILKGSVEEAGEEVVQSVIQKAGLIEFLRGQEGTYQDAFAKVGIVLDQEPDQIWADWIHETVYSGGMAALNVAMLGGGKAGYHHLRQKITNRNTLKKVEQARIDEAIEDLDHGNPLKAEIIYREVNDRDFAREKDLQNKFSQALSDVLPNQDIESPEGVRDAIRQLTVDLQEGNFHGLMNAKTFRKLQERTYGMTETLDDGTTKSHRFKEFTLLLDALHTLPRLPGVQDAFEQSKFDKGIDVLSGMAGRIMKMVEDDSFRDWGERLAVEYSRTQDQRKSQSIDSISQNMTDEFMDLIRASAQREDSPVRGIAIDNDTRDRAMAVQMYRGMFNSLREANLVKPHQSFVTDMPTGQAPASFNESFDMERSPNLSRPQMSSYLEPFTYTSEDINLKHLQDISITLPRNISLSDVPQGEDASIFSLITWVFGEENSRVVFDYAIKHTLQAALVKEGLDYQEEALGILTGRTNPEIVEQLSQATGADAEYIQSLLNEPASAAGEDVRLGRSSEYKRKTAAQQDRDQAERQRKIANLEQELEDIENIEELEGEAREKAEQLQEDLESLQRQEELESLQRQERLETIGQEWADDEIVENEIYAERDPLQDVIPSFVASLHRVFDNIMEKDIYDRFSRTERYDELSLEEWNEFFKDQKRKAPENFTVSQIKQVVQSDESLRLVFVERVRRKRWFDMFYRAKYGESQDPDAVHQQEIERIQDMKKRFARNRLRTLIPQIDPDRRPMPIQERDRSTGKFQIAGWEWDYDDPGIPSAFLDMTLEEFNWWVDKEHKTQDVFTPPHNASTEQWNEVRHLFNKAKMKFNSENIMGILFSWVPPDFETFNKWASFSHEMSELVTGFQQMSDTGYSATSTQPRGKFDMADLNKTFRTRNGMFTNPVLFGAPDMILMDNLQAFFSTMDNKVRLLKAGMKKDSLAGRYNQQKTRAYFSELALRVARNTGLMYESGYRDEASRLRRKLSFYRALQEGTLDRKHEIINDLMEDGYTYEEVQQVLPELLQGMDTINTRELNKVIKDTGKRLETAEKKQTSYEFRSERAMEGPIYVGDPQEAILSNAHLADFSLLISPDDRDITRMKEAGVPYRILDDGEDIPSLLASWGNPDAINVIIGPKHKKRGTAQGKALLEYLSHDNRTLITRQGTGGEKSLVKAAGVYSVRVAGYTNQTPQTATQQASGGVKAKPWETIVDQLEPIIVQNRENIPEDIPVEVRVRIMTGAGGVYDKQTGKVYVLKGDHIDERVKHEAIHKWFEDLPESSRNEMNKRVAEYVEQDPFWGKTLEVVKRINVEDDPLSVSKSYATEFDQTSELLAHILGDNLPGVVGEFDSVKNEAEGLVQDVLNKTPQTATQQGTEGTQAQQQYVPGFTGQLTSNQLGPDDVVVFGSNADGAHRYGGAAFAMFGDTGNHRQDFYKLKSGAQGLRAVKGKPKGIQHGTAGDGYAVQTATWEMREDGSLVYKPLPKATIRSQIKRLYNYARKHPDRTFYVTGARNLNERSMEGWRAEELRDMYLNNMDVPENLQFPDGWAETADQSLPTLTRNTMDNFFQNMLTEWSMEETRSFAEDMGGVRPSDPRAYTNKVIGLLAKMSSSWKMLYDATNREIGRTAMKEYDDNGNLVRNTLMVLFGGEVHRFEKLNRDMSDAEKATSDILPLSPSLVGIKESERLSGYRYLGKTQDRRLVDEVRRQIVEHSEAARPEDSRSPRAWELSLNKEQSNVVARSIWSSTMLDRVARYTGMAALAEIDADYKRQVLDIAKPIIDRVIAVLPTASEAEFAHVDHRMKTQIQNTLNNAARLFEGENAPYAESLRRLAENIGMKEYDSATRRAKRQAVLRQQEQTEREWQLAEVEASLGQTQIRDVSEQQGIEDARWRLGAEGVMDGIRYAEFFRSIDPKAMNDYKINLENNELPEHLLERIEEGERAEAKTLTNRYWQELLNNIPGTPKLKRSLQFVGSVIYRKMAERTGVSYTEFMRRQFNEDGTPRIASTPNEFAQMMSQPEAVVKELHTAEGAYINLWKQGEKAGSSLLGLLNGKATAVTALHEMTHFSMEILGFQQQIGIGSRSEQQLFADLAEFAGAEGELNYFNWSTEAKEKLALGIEEYFSGNGRFSDRFSDRVKRAFINLRRMVRRVARHFMDGVGLPEYDGLSQGEMQMFDRLLGFDAFYDAVDTFEGYINAQKLLPETAQETEEFIPELGRYDIRLNNYDMELLANMQDLMPDDMNHPVTSLVSREVPRQSVWKTLEAASNSVMERQALWEHLSDERRRELSLASRSHKVLINEILNKADQVDQRTDLWASAKDAVKRKFNEAAKQFSVVNKVSHFSKGFYMMKNLWHQLASSEDMAQYYASKWLRETVFYKLDDQAKSRVRSVLDSTDRPEIKSWLQDAIKKGELGATKEMQRRVSLFFLLRHYQARMATAGDKPGQNIPKKIGRRYFNQEKGEYVNDQSLQVLIDASRQTNMRIPGDQQEGGGFAVTYDNLQYMEQMLDKMMRQDSFSFIYDHMKKRTWAFNNWIRSLEVEKNRKSDGTTDSPLAGPQRADYWHVMFENDLQEAARFGDLAAARLHSIFKPTQKSEKKVSSAQIAEIRNVGNMRLASMRGALGHTSMPILDYTLVMGTYMKNTLGDHLKVQHIHDLLNRYGLSKEEYRRMKNSLDPRKRAAASNLRGVTTDTLIKSMQGTRGEEVYSTVLAVRDAMESLLSDDRIHQERNPYRFAEEMQEIIKENDAVTMDTMLLLAGYDAETRAEAIREKGETQVFSEVQERIQERIRIMRESREDTPARIMRMAEEIVEDSTGDELQALYRNIEEDGTAWMSEYLKNKALGEMAKDMQVYAINNHVDDPVYMPKEYLQQLEEWTSTSSRFAVEKMFRWWNRQWANVVLFGSGMSFQVNNLLGDQTFALQMGRGFWRDQAKKNYLGEAAAMLNQMLTTGELTPKAMRIFQTGLTDQGQIAELTGTHASTLTKGFLANLDRELKTGIAGKLHNTINNKEVTTRIMTQITDDLMQWDISNPRKLLRALAKTSFHTATGFNRRNPNVEGGHIRWQDMGVLPWNWITAQKGVSIARESLQRIAYGMWVYDQMDKGEFTPALSGGAHSVRMKEMAASLGGQVNENGDLSFEPSAVKNMNEDGKWQLASMVSSETFGDYQDVGNIDRLLRVPMPFWMFPKIDHRRQFNSFLNFSRETGSFRAAGAGEFIKRFALVGLAGKMMSATFAGMTGMLRGAGGDDDEEYSERDLGFLDSMASFNRMMTWLPLVKWKGTSVGMRISTAQAEFMQRWGIPGWLEASKNAMFGTIPDQYQHENVIQYIGKAGFRDGFNWASFQMSPPTNIIRSIPGLLGGTEGEQFEAGFQARREALGMFGGIWSRVIKGTYEGIRYGNPERFIKNIGEAAFKWGHINVKDRDRELYYAFRFSTLPEPAYQVTPHGKKIWPVKRELMTSLYHGYEDDARKAFRKLLKLDRRPDESNEGALRRWLKSRSPYSLWQFTGGARDPMALETEKGVIGYNRWLRSLNRRDKMRAGAAYRYYYRMVDNAERILGVNGRALTPASGKYLKH